MPDHDLRTSFDALSARLQAELQAQAAQLTDRIAEEREKARIEADAQRAAAVEAVREEWDGRLQASLADAAAEAERHRKELDALRDEWQRRLQAGLADAAADADRRVSAETDRIRREVEAPAAASVERAREETRRDMEQAAAQSAAELEGERGRVQQLLSDERGRAAAAIESERLKAQTLSAALEEAQAALASERAAARAAETALFAARGEHQTSAAQALVEARAAERQSHVAIVERLLGAMQSIGQARSLSDTLTALTDAAATLAPRAALFIVNGPDLHGWRAAGFEGGVQATMVLGAHDRAARGLFDRAIESGRSVTTAAEAAPPFARLPANRSGLAVPVVVGGHGVAVLYADDASLEDPDAPSAWPEAIQLLAAHASACVSQITALRTAQALQQQLSAGGTSQAGSGSGVTDDDSSARRYARLLVSEIKLYNEAAVRAGREKGDLLHRLRPEIDRARRLYEERVSPAIGARTVYFQQELVHTLADGDSALLGGTL